LRPDEREERKMDRGRFLAASALATGVGLSAADAALADDT